MVATRIVRVIDLDRAVHIAGKSWEEIRDELRKVVGSTAEADTVIEDAKARAAEIVKKQLGRDVPELADRVAKYIVAFMLAERE